MLLLCMDGFSDRMLRFSEVDSVLEGWKTADVWRPRMLSCRVCPAYADQHEPDLRTYHSLHRAAVRVQ